MCQIGWHAIGTRRSLEVLMLDEKQVRFDKAEFLSMPPIITVNHGFPTDLYVMGCDGFVKVGIAGDVERRLRTIQAMNAKPVSLLKRYHFNHRTAAKLAEAGTHRALRDFHHAGEWFATTPETACAAIHLVRLHLKSLLEIHGRHDRRLPHYHDAF
jgi:hypothetical protein